MKPDAVKDRLTGLMDFDSFINALAEHIGCAGDQSVSLSLIDVDWFGKINDSHGPEISDELLKKVAEHLVESLGDAGTVFRYGGDAFVTLFDNTERERAFLLTESARESFDKEREIGRGVETIKLHATLSAGVAAYPDDGNDETAIMRKVNEALYRAKVTGRNKVCLAREEKMVTKTSHYTQGQLQGLARLAKRMGIGEAMLLREALDDLLRKHNS